MLWIYDEFTIKKLYVVKSSKFTVNLLLKMQVNHFDNTNLLELK